MKHLSALLFLSLPSLLFAQTPVLEWGHALIGQGNLTNYINAGSDVVVNATGHVYMSGGFAHNLDFDPSGAVAELNTPSQTDFDGFIAKYDSLGAFIWVKQIITTSNSYIHEMALAPNGDVVISGYLNGNTDFDPSPAVFELTGYADVFLARYNGAGDMLWAKGFGSPTALEELHALEIDPAGNIWVAGEFADTLDMDPGPGTAQFISYAPGSTDGFFGKYNSDGEFQWGHTLSVDWLDRVKGIAFDAFGNAVVTGYFQGSCDLEPGPGVTMITATSPSEDTFIARYTTDGLLLNAITFGGAASDMEPASIAVDGNGDIIACGELYGNDASLTPGQVIGTIDAGSYTYGWLAKYSSSGSLIWGEVFSCSGSSGPNFDEMKLDSDGDILISGFHVNSFDADPGPNNLQLPASSDDGYLLKYANADGALVWAVPIGGSGSQHLYGLHVDAADHIYITGGGYAMFPFNGAELGGGNNAILMKTGECFPPNILFGPAIPLELCEGFEMDLHVEAEGTALHYQWLLDGVPVGGDSDSLHVGPLPTGEGEYQCIVTGPCGVDSSEVVLFMGEDTPNPVITEVLGLLHANASGTYYMWLLNGNMIPGANGPTWTPTENGTYTVGVSYSGICWGFSPPYYYGGIGITEAVTSSITVVHMPGDPFIRVQNAGIGTTIDVFDLTGKRVAHGTATSSTASLSMSSQPRGVYLVRAEGRVFRVVH